MLKRAGELRAKGLTAEEIEPVLLRLVHENCEGPIDDDKVITMAHSICNFPAGKDDTFLHGGKIVGSEPDVKLPNNEAADENKIITDPQEAKKLMDELGIRDYNSLLTGNLRDGREPWIFRNVQRPREVPSKPTEWILDRMIVLGGLHIFSSLPGGEKSILSLVLTKTIAGGEGLFGRKNSGRSRYVVVLDRENPPSIVYERLRGLGLLDLENVFVWGEWDEKAGPCPESFDDPRLIECARIMGEDVVFVADSLSAFSEGKDENSVQEMNPIVRKALKLARMSGGVILLHHTDKGGNFGRGTVAIRANADMAFLMDKNGEVVTIGPEKFRSCPVWTLKFEMDWGGTTGVFTPKLILDSLAPSALTSNAEPSLEDMKKRDKQNQAEATRRHFVGAAQVAIQKAYDAALAGTGKPLNKSALATLIGLDPNGKLGRSILNGAEGNPWSCVQGEQNNAVIFVPKGVTEVPPMGGAKKGEAKVMFKEGKTIKATAEALSIPTGTVSTWRVQWKKEDETAA
jgi:AAA domain